VEAVKAIVKIGTQSSLDPLVKAAHDTDWQVQALSVDGLVNFYLPGYVAKGLTGPVTRGMRQMKGFFSSRDDQTIDAGVTIRTEVGQAVSDQIRMGATLDVRSNAARAAGILRDQQALPELERALRSKETQLIFESLVALQKIHDPSAGPSVTFLAHDLDDKVQVAALETIGILRNVDAEPEVRSAVDRARDGKTRKAALQALAMLGVASDRQLFLQYLNDKDEDLRVAALEGLGRIRDPEDVAKLRDAYNEKDGAAKAHLAAAFALVNEGQVETSDFSPLLYLVENLDGPRDDAASAYLTELCRRPAVRKALFPKVGDMSKGQKIAAARALALSRDSDVIPALTALSKDTDRDVSLAAGKDLRLVGAGQP
jgi:HEAT repeat protein